MAGNQITLHNTPQFYKAYMENWLAHQKKENANAAQVAVVEDIKTLVKVAIGVLDPEPAEPVNNKK